MQEEINSLHKNKIYELVELPKGKKALRTKRVFKLKKDNEKLVKYKAQFLVKGFIQKFGVDFDEIFSLVVKISFIRAVPGLVASLDLELEQLDVKITFLHGDLEEEIHMVQPKEFEVKGKNHSVQIEEEFVWLEASFMTVVQEVDSYMVGHGYTKTNADHCVYVKKFPDGKFLILLLYVDVMLIVGQDVSLIGNLKKDLFKAFDMKDLGPAQQILGMEITCVRKSRRYGCRKKNMLSGYLKGST